LEKKDLIKEDFKVLSTNKEIIQIETITNKFSKKEFNVQSKNQFEFRLNTFNFPGWEAQLDGKEIKINNNNDYKLITVLVPEGNHKLSFIFKNTLVRTLGNLISIIFLIGLIICIILK